jgi:hemoglobin
MVLRFYALARADERLGPLFEAAIEDWDGHVRIVQDFWSHHLLGTMRYQGSPFPVHVGLKVDDDHFDRWLAALRAAATETLPPNAASIAIARAEHMSKSFRVGLVPWTPGSKPDTSPGSKPDTSPGSKPDTSPGSKPDTSPGSKT